MCRCDPRHARRRRRWRNDARGGLGRGVPTVHSCAHCVHRHFMIILPRWIVTSAERIHTELAAHSGQGVFTNGSSLFYSRIHGAALCFR